jgi:UDP-3-O-[3-hydroxymyristoyl] glucosamine N-acyltransferase
VQLTAREIAEIVGGTLAGNPEAIVTGIAGIKEAQPGDATFVGSAKYAAALKTTRASVVLVAAGMAGEAAQTLIRVENPGKAFERLIARIAPPPIQLAPGVHPTAIIGGTAKLGRDVTIQPHVVIEDGVTVGDRTVIGAGSYIGHESSIGDDCRLYPRVTFRERIRVGHRVVIHSGVVLGADGFGFEFAGGRYKKIPQVGNVEIGDDVEIGANTAIDRARFGTTRIGKGTKIDNLVQIAHNCVVGEHCIICGLVGMAGSTTLGDYVTIAGQVGLAGHLTIGDRSIVMAQSGVAKDVPPGSYVLGAPALPHKQAKRVMGAMNRLPDMVTRLRELEQQLAEMRGRLDTMK